MSEPDRSPIHLYQRACNGWKPDGVRMSKDWDPCSMEVESARRYLGSWAKDAQIIECVAWFDGEDALHLMVADFANGRRVILRQLARSAKVTFSRWKEIAKAEAPAQDAA